MVAQLVASRVLPVSIDLVGCLVSIGSTDMRGMLYCFTVMLCTEENKTLMKAIMRSICT